MRRRTFDTLVSFAGLLMAAVLVMAGGLLLWASVFVGNQVHDQLAAQQVFFPPAGSPAIDGPQFAGMQQYAGQQLTTPEQAKTYANDFIGVHLNEVAGGQTYAQVSTAAQADPTDTTLQAQKATLFAGETLRGLLLNAYAFGTIGAVAGVAAVVSFIAAAIMLLLVALGFWHARRGSGDDQIFEAPRPERIPA